MTGASPAWAMPTSSTGTTIDVTMAPYNTPLSASSDGCDLTKNPSPANAQPGLQAAIDVAQTTAGNKVYLPAGFYCVNGQVGLNGTKKGGNFAITFSGPSTVPGTSTPTTAATASARLVEFTMSDLFHVGTDKAIVQDLILDTKTNGCSGASIIGCGLGHALGNMANNTQLIHVQALTPTPTVPYDSHFNLYYAGRGNPAGYATGNKLNDVIVKDGICDDSISWSFQENSSLTNVQHTGSHIALYGVRNVTVNGYTFTPGPQAAMCPGRVGGWGITSPASDVTMTNYTLTGPVPGGGGGGNLHIGSAPGTGGTLSCININNEMLTGAGGHLQIDDVTPALCANGSTYGLIINGGSFGTNGSINFSPQTVMAGGTTQIVEQVNNVTVKNVKSLPQVRFVAQPPSNGGGTVSNLVLLNDVFPGYMPVTGQTSFTAQDPFGAAVTLTIGGGSWSLPQGAKPAFWAQSKKAADLSSCMVTNLAGYSGPASAC